MCRIAICVNTCTAVALAQAQARLQTLLVLRSHGRKSVHSESCCLYAKVITLRRENRPKTFQRYQSKFQTLWSEKLGKSNEFDGSANRTNREIRNIHMQSS